MTARTASRRGATSVAAGRTIAVRRVEDRALLRRRLDAAPAYAAYAIACLDARLLPTTRFFEAELGERRALVMHSRGGLGPSTLLMGDTRLIPTLLNLHPGRSHTLLTCEPDQVEEALRTYHLWRPQVMVRMQLDKSAFSVPADMPVIRRLIGADAGELNRLYALEDDGIWYSPKQVSEGAYFGAHHRGRLVAAAGTHIHSSSQRVAVVGNVFTHPDFRGHGLGTAVTAAVTAHLLQSCDTIVLSVDPNNRVAHRIYERLGYRDTGRLVEAMATLRQPLSPLPLVRRLLARWRSPTPGVEVVKA